MEDVTNEADILCCVHLSCVKEDDFNSIECDCREQLEMSQAMIQKAGRGIVGYLDLEGKGNIWR